MNNYRKVAAKLCEDLGVGDWVDSEDRESTYDYIEEVLETVERNTWQEASCMLRERSNKMSQDLISQSAEERPFNKLVISELMNYVIIFNGRANDQSVDANDEKKS